MDPAEHTWRRRRLQPEEIEREKEREREICNYANFMFLSGEIKKKEKF